MVEVKVINKIGEKIDEYVQKYGSSKSWIAKQINVSRQTLNTIINSQNPTIETIVKLSVVLDCDYAELFDTEIVQDGMIIKITRTYGSVSLKNTDVK